MRLFLSKKYIGNRCVLSRLRKTQSRAGEWRRFASYTRTAEKEETLFGIMESSETHQKKRQHWSEVGKFASMPFTRVGISGYTIDR